VIVGPYNSVLTLQWLIDHPDIVIFLDNAALYRVASEAMRVPTPSFDHINAMASKIMTSVTAPMRFYSPVYTRLSHIVAHLNPFPPMQFIQPAYAPFSPTDTKFVTNTSAAKILNRILEPKSMISSAGSAPLKGRKSSVKVDHCMLSALAILQTDGLDYATDVGIRQKISKNNIMYPPWSSSTLNITSCRLTPYMEHKYHASGLLLANHTNITTVLSQIADQYDQMHKRKANLHQYEKAGCAEQMNESRERLGQLMELYEEATTSEFMEEVRRDMNSSAISSAGNTPVQAEA